MNDSKTSIQELKNLGFQEEQIQDVMKMGEQEILDHVLEDFAFNAPEPTVDEYVNKISKAQGNPEQFSHLINEIMGIQYGAENVEKKKDELLTEYLQNIIALTKNTKEVYQKYSQGDPETKQAIEAAKTSKTVQKIAEIIDENQPNG